MDARPTPHWLALTLSVVAACGSAESTPFFDDARYLHFGVDPRVEADAVESQLKRAGFHVDARAEGPHHVALGLVDAAAERTAIRVVTAVGTVLSLDGDANIEHARRYKLLTPENLRGVRVLPQGEIFVLVAGERADEACVAGFRIDSRGTLSRIVIDAGAVIVDGCASELLDSDGDGAVELVVHAAYRAFSIDDVPLVRVPLVAHGGGYRWVAGAGPVVTLLHEQQEVARQDLLAARRVLNVERAYRSAVELAALARFRGEGAGAQLRVFDDALRGLVLTGRQASQSERARGLIRAGWHADTDPPVSSELPMETEAAEEVPAAP